MSITDELREWAERGLYYKERRDELTAIADRIDEQAEEECEAAWQRGYERGEDDAKFEQLDELRKEVQADWVPLPTDAHGKVIHVEDEVELLDGSKRFKAEWLEWDGDDWVVHETIGYGIWHEPRDLRNVEQDTFERIIGDAITVGWPNGSWNEVASAEIHDRLVERCRRLAERKEAGS